MRIFASQGPMIEVEPGNHGSLYVRLGDHVAMVKWMQDQIDKAEQRLRESVSGGEDGRPASRRSAE